LWAYFHLKKSSIWRSVRVCINPGPFLFMKHLSFFAEIPWNPSKGLHTHRPLLSLLLYSHLMDAVVFSGSEMHIVKVFSWPREAAQHGTSENHKQDSAGCLFASLWRKEQTLHTWLSSLSQRQKKIERKKKKAFKKSSRFKEIYNKTSKTLLFNNSLKKILIQEH